MSTPKYLKSISLILVILIISVPVCFALEMKLVYDANGNLVTGDGEYRTYNSQNQLWRVYNGSNSSGYLMQEYTYHPIEERILVKKTYNSSGSLIETVYYVNQNFVQVKNLSGTYNFTYIYNEGQLVAQLNPDGTKYYFVNDAKGDLVTTINSTGQVIDANQYSPTGEILSSNNKSRYSYEGKEYDKTTGQTDYNFRLYTPSTYLFGVPDTLIQNVYDPQSLNRFTFERNNPFKYTDSSGHYPKSALNWGRFFMGGVQAVSSLAGGAGLLGLSIFGTPESLGASDYVGIPLAIICFGNAGHGAVDSLNAWDNNEDYFNEDQGGISADVGNVMDGKTGATIGKVIDTGISIYTMTSDLPTPGSSAFNKYVTAITSFMDTSYNLESYLYGDAPMNSNNAQCVAPSASSSHVGGGGSGGGHGYHYTNPTEYPNDPQGVCVAPQTSSNNQQSSDTVDSLMNLHYF